MIEDLDRELAIYFDYQFEPGTDEAMAELVISRLVDILPEKQFGHAYLNDAYRSQYAAHLRQTGTVFPPRLVPELWPFISAVITEHSHYS